MGGLPEHGSVIAPAPDTAVDKLKAVGSKPLTPAVTNGFNAATAEVLPLNTVVNPSVDS